MMLHKLTYLSIALAAAALAGCQATSDTQEPVQQPQQVQQPDQVQPPPSAQTSCEPQLIEFAIGQEATTELIEQVRLKTGATVIRLLLPNQPTTREFNPTRANVQVNYDYVVQEITCF